MSVETTLAAVGTDIGLFFSKLKNDILKAKAVWAIISDQQTRSVLMTLGKQVITTVKDAEGAVAANGFNFTLDAQVISDIKQLVADAEAGDGVILADLKALGVTL